MRQKLQRLQEWVLRLWRGPQAVAEPPVEPSVEPHFDEAPLIPARERARIIARTRELAHLTNRLDVELSWRARERQRTTQDAEGR